MIKSTIQPQNIFLALDCEFTETGLVRELSILLFNHNRIVRALEVFISPSGEKTIKYNPQQINYHIASVNQLNASIDAFLKNCLSYCPLKDMKLVGMSIDSDLAAILKTTNAPSLLNTIGKKTQLEICERGTLEVKAQRAHITRKQIQTVLSKLMPHNHTLNYRYHTALYDTIVTGYVYFRLTHTGFLGVHDRFKKCTHTYFNQYYDDMNQKNKSLPTSIKKKKGKDQPAHIGVTVTRKVPRNFPSLNYKVQKNISTVFDIVPRQIWYEKTSKMYYEPSIKKGYSIKEGIMKEVFEVKCEVEQYDTGILCTDPYNIYLVQAGVRLVEKKVSIEDFIDYAIYMQQYNLPNGKGSYFKVWDETTGKELFIRCLKESTAKKLLAKKPYCTIEQFLRKRIPICNIEKLS